MHISESSIEPTSTNAMHLSSTFLLRSLNEGSLLNSFDLAVFRENLGDLCLSVDLPRNVGEMKGLRWGVD